jgi:hypothetical protein
MSRAQLYNRSGDGSIKPQKDAAHTYITRQELELPEGERSAIERACPAGERPAEGGISNPCLDRKRSV